MRKKIGMNVTEASEYLRDVINIPPHQIRLLAQRGECPFCMALKSSSGHWSYYVHQTKLEAYKQGKLELLKVS